MDLPLYEICNKKMKITLLITLSIIFMSSCTTKKQNQKGASDKNKSEDTKNNIVNKNELKLPNQEIKKSGKMLDETLFWSIIDLSIQNSPSEYEQEIYLVNQIEKLSTEEIIGFKLRTDKLLSETYTSEMWCAGYIMNGGCSDDGFEYFRNWIISRGKETFYSAKETPDNLISEYLENKFEYEFEGFWYVAITAFQNQTGTDLNDYISEDFYKNEVHYKPIDITWEEDRPETMKAICPKLYEKMMN